MSDPQIINEEPVINEPQSEEAKFFGVSTEINSDSADDIQIEVVDDTPEEDRGRQKREGSGERVDNDSVDAEISDYSQRAADRITEIKHEYHQERRGRRLIKLPIIMLYGQNKAQPKRIKKPTKKVMRMQWQNHKSFFLRQRLQNSRLEARPNRFRLM